MSPLPSRLVITLALVLATLSWAAGPIQSVHAATLTVTDCSGETGVGRIGTVLGSASAGDTIGFNCSGTIPITSTLTIGATNLTLDGSGQTVILDGGGTTQVVVVGGGITFSLTNLTLSHGFTSGSGGAIENAGTLTITKSTLSGNSSAPGGNGGAILNNGTVTITNSTLSGNSAGGFNGPGNGGAIFGSGTLTITNSTFSGNSAGGFNAYGNGDDGGAISGSGTVTITNSTFSGNSVRIGDGGAISNGSGTVAISSSTFSSNSADNTGGAISSGGTLTVTSSTFSGNSATAGGAIDSELGSTLITSSTIESNSASIQGGAIYSVGVPSLNAGTLTITSSTIAGNCADSASNNTEGGAISNNAGTVTITNSTLWNNSTYCGNAGDTVGGAIYNGGAFTDLGVFPYDGGRVTITSSTLAGNSASMSGGAIFNEQYSTVSIGGSIIAGNSASNGGNCNNSPVTYGSGTTSWPGVYIDRGYNLEDTSPSTCFFSSASPYHDLVGSNPLLDVPSNNGGPTQTTAFIVGSPAIDYIPTSSGLCPATDQRGYGRPDDGESTCDIGAYESGASAPDADLSLTGVPANITVEATGPSGATVTYTPPTAVDESGDSPAATLTCDHASGSTFALGTTTVTCTATDADDSPSSVSQSFTVTVQDTTPPTLQLPATITVNATSASGAVVTYSASATDLVDGTDPVTCVPASGSTFPVATTIVSCSATDQAGNTATGSFTVTVNPFDSSAPTTTISLSPAQPTGQNGWYTGGVTVSVSATDPDNSSTTLTTRCVLDPAGVPATYSDLPVGSCPYAVNGGAAVRSDGVHTLYVASEDPTGNVEAVQKSTFQIDQTAPTGVTATPDRAPNAAGWYTSPVTVSAPHATDATSGLASCTSPTYNGPDSTTASLTVTCTDKAGNSASATYSFQYDATPPTVACTTPAPTFVYGQSGAAVPATVSDATSGPAQASISAPASTSSVGSSLSVSLTGTDRAGNTTTQSCSYAVTKASTSTSLSSSLTPSMSGQAVTFTATLGVQSPGAGSIGGSVTFDDGTTTLGTGTVSTTNGISTATYTISSLALGGHAITAVYAGSSTMTGSTSATLTQNVDTDLSGYPTLSSGAFNLGNVNLAGGYFVNLDLVGASFDDANMSGGDFSGVDLTGANLTDANFSNTDLSGANLTNANLTQTNLKGATGMSTATLTGVIWSKTTCPDNTTSSQDGGTCLNNLTP